MPPLSSGTYYAPLESALGKAPDAAGAAAAAVTNNGTVVGAYRVDGVKQGYVWDPTSGAVLAVGIGYNDKTVQLHLSAYNTSERSCSTSTSRASSSGASTSRRPGQVD
jgi:phage protein D